MSDILDEDGMTSNQKEKAGLRSGAEIRTAWEYVSEDEEEENE